MTKITMISFKEAYRRLLRYAGGNMVLRRGFSKKKVEAEIEKKFVEEKGGTEAEERFWLLYKILIENVSVNPKLRQELLKDMMGYVGCLMESLPGDPWGRQVVIDVFGVPYRIRKVREWEEHSEATEELLVRFQEIVRDTGKVTDKEASKLLTEIRGIKKANDVLLAKVIRELERIIKK